MVNDTVLSNNDSVVPVVYLVLRLETPSISYMSTPLFDTKLIDLEVPNLARSAIGSSSQPY